MERDRIYEKMQALAEVGPTFVFEAVDGLHPLQRVRAAYLVGETGLYMYDFENDGAQALSVVEGHEFSKPVDLAKSLGPVESRPVLARATEHAANIRSLTWYVLLDGKGIPLETAGDYGPIPIRRARSS
jgi:hypothetical protein